MRRVKWRQPNPRPLHPAEARFPCDVCGGKPGEYCRTKGGFGALEVHSNRLVKHMHSPLAPDYTVYVPPEDIPQPKTRVVAIECIFTNPETQTERDALEAALDELRGWGAAEITRSELLEDEYQDAARILMERRVHEY